MKYIFARLNGFPPPSLDIPRRTGSRRAIQGVPLPDVLRAFRLAFIILWQHLLEEARAESCDAVTALMDSSTMMWALADEYPLAVSEGYRNTLRERTIAADRRRIGILSALFDNDQRHSAWELAALLDLPFDGWFLVAVIRSSTQSGQSFHEMTAVETRLDALEVSLVWRAQPDQEELLLSGPVKTDIGDIVRALGHADRRIGLSPVFTRIDEASRGRRLAKIAVAGIAVGRPGTRQLHDDAKLDLLVRDKETTRTLVRRVLGPVLDLPSRERDVLIETARAWLSSKCSATVTARGLYCHANTVRYRIHRLESLLGNSLGDPTALGDLAMALQAIEIFPDTAT